MNMADGFHELLAIEAKMGLIGARFLFAAGKTYTQRMDHGDVERRYGLGQAGNCYHHAYELALAHPELTYCEGRASTVWPVEHAWCVTPEGLVVDGTWEAGEAHYFGACFSNDFLLRWVRETRRLGVLSEIFPHQLLHWSPLDYLANPSADQVTALRELQAEFTSKPNR